MLAGTYATETWRQVSTLGDGTPSDGSHNVDVGYVESEFAELTAYTP